MSYYKITHVAAISIPNIYIFAAPTTILLRKQ